MPSNSNKCFKWCDWLKNDDIKYVKKCHLYIYDIALY